MAIATYVSETPFSLLRQNYEQMKELFDNQPQTIQKHLDFQSQKIAEQLLKRSARIRFVLPERIYSVAQNSLLPIISSQREQTAGSLFNFSGLQSPRRIFINKLSELENSSDSALALAGNALRFTLATTLVHRMLPDGNTVHYAPEQGEEIPSVPVGKPESSALISKSDVITQGEGGELNKAQVPFAPHAQKFFLPQWVGINEDDSLITKTVDEAESVFASMQGYLEILHQAVAIAPYILADETYQRKRSGMLGQLTNQGRALARYHTREIINKIERRANTNNLNRGLSLSLPYFDDQKLTMEIYPLDIIPNGRIVFIPAFVVRAVRLEYSKVAQDTRLSSSTRKHLLTQFALLENAFLKHSKGK